MASAYFTLPSFARAKKHQQELEKQNPQIPVLKDEDEKFLERQISRGEAASELDDAEPSKISDDGVETKASKADQLEAGGDQIVIPEDPPQARDGAGEPKSSPTKNKKQGFDLPSQEEAEAATHNLIDGAKDANSNNPEQSGDKRTWASYLPASMTSSFTKKADSAATDKPSNQATETTDQRTWAAYASSYVPSLPNLLSKDKDANVEPVYNADGTVDEEATKAKQEREVSVLLDNLNLSSINNRVFALSAETQKIYDRFALVLKDTMNGGPTAYEDMEKLMKEAGPQLEKQFKSMPPFVQTLVKSLPAKLGATLAPELLAAASDKPGADLKTMQASSSSSGKAGTEPSKKKKRRIPGLKSLIGKQGAVAGILRSVVSFLRVRFPLLASGTNVVMSLAVFILMFVFWYCHKRGKETRLAREAEANDAEKVEGGADDGEDGDFDESDSDNEKEVVGEPGNDKADILNQKSPSEVPLPADDENGELK